MSEAGYRRDVRRARQRENIGLIAGLFSSLAQGLVGARNQAEEMRLKQARMALEERDTATKEMDATTKQREAAIGEQRAGTYEESSRMENLARLIAAEGKNKGGFTPTAEQTMGAIQGLLGSGATGPGDWPAAYARRKAELTKGLGTNILDQFSPSAQIAKRGLEQLEGTNALANRRPDLLWPNQTPPGGEPGQDPEEQQAMSFAQAYRTAVMGNPGDPNQPQAWSKLMTAFPQLVPSWIKAQAMGNFSGNLASATGAPLMGQQLHQLMPVLLGRQLLRQ